MSVCLCWPASVDSTHTYIRLTEEFVAGGVFVEALLDDLVGGHGVVEDGAVLLRLAADGGGEVGGGRPRPLGLELVPQLAV